MYLIEGELKIVPYPYEVTEIWVFVGEEYAKRRIKKLFDIDHDRLFGAIAMTTLITNRVREKRIIIISLAEGEPNRSAIAHEVIHTVFEVLEMVGIKVTAENAEMFTYLNDYINLEILEKLYEIKEVERFRPGKAKRLIKIPEKKAKAKK